MTEDERIKHYARADRIWWRFVYVSVATPTFYAAAYFDAPNWVFLIVGTLSANAAWRSIND